MAEYKHKFFDTLFRQFAGIHRLQDIDTVFFQQGYMAAESLITCRCRHGFETPGISANSHGI